MGSSPRLTGTDGSAYHPSSGFFTSIYFILPIRGLVLVAFAGRGQRSVDWRLRYAAVGLFARGRPCCHLSLVLCLLARMALLCPHLGRRLGMDNLGKSLLLSRQLPRNGQAIRYIGLISRLGLQLRLDLARVVIRQSTVAAGVG